jgi:predicted amidohydrolase
MPRSQSPAGARTFRFEWNRADVLRAAIEVPGPETAVLAKNAQQYGCYIVFGSYVRDDKDCPNHSLSITTILGPDGQIVDKHWKARNIMGVFTAGREPIELMTSTIYNCLDRYVEMYGADAVIPVTRTPLGNICTSSVQREPELFRAMTLKGGELFLRTATGGFTPADIQACSMYNGVYTAICNNSISPGNKGIWEDAGGGGSAVYDPRGEIPARPEAPQLEVASTRAARGRPTAGIDRPGPASILRSPCAFRQRSLQRRARRAARRSRCAPSPDASAAR